MVITIAGLCILMILLWQGMKKSVAEWLPSTTPATHYTPEAFAGDIYHKPNFSLSYVEKYELPEWVSYTLTIDMMNKPKYPRDQDFEPDPEIRTKSAHYHDYKGSGYRRGHLVPSADMAWDKTSMDATFLLSNIAPMRAAFNDGIWLDLENQVRDWSRLYKSVQVVAGPVFSEVQTTIGKNEVAVPRYFYKAVFTRKNDQPLVIGFLFDQTEPEFRPLSEYIVPIDSIEKLTGIDLFSGLFGDWDTEIKMEQARTEPGRNWPINY